MESRGMIVMNRTTIESLRHVNPRMTFQEMVSIKLDVPVYMVRIDHHNYYNESFDEVRIWWEKAAD